MRTTIVFTLTGTDRVGIVDEVTQLLLESGGNIETSRMTRLGGEFAVLILVSLPAEGIALLERALPRLIAAGYKVTTTPTDRTAVGGRAGWLPYQVDLRGADHEGIIHEVAHALSQCGITIESLDTGTGPAPISGAPLFTMTALIAVPPALADRPWMTALQEAARRLDVEVEVSAVAKP